jgi:plasmid stabilization system protein ParE
MQSLKEYEDNVEKIAFMQSVIRRKTCQRDFLKTETLSAFPESGRIVPEFSMPNLREIIFPPFRIVYKFEDTRVRIVRVWRSERLLKLP